MTPPQERETLIAGLERMRAVEDIIGGYENVKLLDACLAYLRAERTPHDNLCESELTSHGYTPCRCAERTQPQCQACASDGVKASPAEICNWHYQKALAALAEAESSPSPARQGERTQDLVGAVRLIAQKVGVCQLYGPADSARWAIDQAMRIADELATHVAAPAAPTGEE